MTGLKDIRPFLETIAKVCGIEFHVYHNGCACLSTTSFSTGIRESERQSAMAGFALHAKPFHAALQSDGAAICGVPLTNPHGHRSWLIALVPNNGQHRAEQDVMPLLRSLGETINDRWQHQQEIDEFATALDHSFEELALYRRIQKSLRTGTLSSKQMLEILSRLRDILQADLVFGHFPTASDLNATVTDPGLHEKLDLETFTPELIKNISNIKADIEDNHFIVNNSLSDPFFAPLCRRPFRLMAARSVHNDQTHGWIGVVSFNYYAFFKRSHLNIVQAAASQAALAGANRHLLKGLEGLTTQVQAFKQEISNEPDPYVSTTSPGGRPTDEFLNKALNDLSDSIAATKALMLRSTQMATMGQMAAVFAHEIKQPICALDGFIQIAKLKQTDPGQSEDLKMMGKAVRRITRIVQRFESFSQPHESEEKPVSLNIIAREVYQLVTPQLEYKKIEGRFQRATDLPEIIGDAQSLQQAVLNLVSNAIAAMESNNGQRSELRLTTYRQGRYACLDVTDNGHGISEELVGKITAPYFTTKSSGKGTGLGLSVVTDIAKQHNGRLEIDSTPGKGSRFTLKIPVSMRPH